MPRIAIVDHTAELGGAELALLRMLEHLDGPPFDVVAILFADGPLVMRLRAAGHAVEVLPIAPSVGELRRERAAGAAGLLGAMRLIPFVVRLARRLRALDVDVIHSTSLKADLVALPAALLARRPLVWHVHDRIADDYLPRPLVWLLRTLARTSVTAVVANSEATARTLPGARGLVVAPPGLAAHQISDEAVPPAPQPPVVGLVGRISPTKGQLGFVRAAALVHRALPAVRFRIVGEASFGHEAYRDEVLDTVQQLGLTGVVELPGFVTDPVRELDGLSVAVHAATVPEPFGQVVVEAMARAVPVVATAGGGVDEIMDDGSGALLGWSVPPRDPEALARAIIEAVTDVGEAGRRATAAWASVQERFPSTRTAGVVGEVWRSVSDR